MVSNPMQRKSRNSFLLGMVVALLISGIVIVALFLMLKEKSDELAAEKAAQINVYTLTEDVKAGQTLTEDMFELTQVNANAVPSNATATLDVIESWFLQTKEGELVYTDQYGFYLDRSFGEKSADSIIEIFENTGEAFKDSKNNKVDTGDFYVNVNGVIEKVKENDNVITDDYGKFFVDTQNNDTITRVYQEELTEEFYIYRLETTNVDGQTAKKRVKEYISIKNVPVLAKVDMNMNTVITPEFVVQSDEIISNDLRKEEYNMIVLPIDLTTNDYVDIRLMTPSGQNFIVISKVQVEIPMNADGTYVVDTIRVNLREDEILAMSSAIVEAYGLAGAKLYVTKYVDPAMQAAALPTYTPNADVTAQMQSNPNIVDEAKEELASRYSAAAKDARNQYLQELINKSEEFYSTVGESMNEGITNSNAARQKYLESLGYTGEEEE